MQHDALRERIELINDALAGKTESLQIVRDKIKEDAIKIYQYENTLNEINLKLDQLLQFKRTITDELKKTLDSKNNRSLCLEKIENESETLKGSLSELMKEKSGIKELLTYLVEKTRKQLELANASLNTVE
ncbi:hypothetical protein O9G_006347 [Rozella allomycis CSF55]|uniref:Uncharacterized protein n=1 Tax=Rozella allomycis (strain CSF55) TaxID=988480 RepID=A0A075AQX4_ROZAC|nr:hypothetical protein O9G_006347 [Rozella allomycis CSF55]|eukprot:EPZ31080.1 hypothetical protein O9G_006347 [Rozella allomycis CSF55]